MKPPNKPTALEAWKAIEEGSFRAEVDRIVGLSDQELEAELLKEGFDRADLAGPETVVKRAIQRFDERARRRAAPVRPVRSARLISWLAAAAFGLLAVVTAVERNGIIAWFRHEPIAPVPSREFSPPKVPDLELARQERAKALRDEAYPACGRAAWTLCESKLDEAKALDPSGEQDPNVQTARREIYLVRHPDAESPFPDTKWVRDAGRR